MAYNSLRWEKRSLASGGNLSSNRHGSVDLSQTNRTADSAVTPDCSIGD
jgi:hypothetical protein